MESNMSDAASDTTRPELEAKSQAGCWLKVCLRTVGVF